MFGFTIFKNIFKFSGLKVSSYLEELANTLHWKEHHPQLVGMGYSVDDDGCEHHYIDRMVLAEILTDILNKRYTFTVRTSDECACPVSNFETWSPPGNQEYAIDQGYLDYLDEDEGFVSMKHGWCPSSHGAWRGIPPCI
jgi:hypothetical protein